MEIRLFLVETEDQCVMRCILQKNLLVNLEMRENLYQPLLSQTSHITCVGNDYGFANIFSKYIEGVGKKGDALLAISTSGNSENIINAAKTAKEKGMKVVSLTGKDGGELSKLSDIEIRVSHLGYSDRIQEIHIKVIHILILLIEN